MAYYFGLALAIIVVCGGIGIFLRRGAPRLD